MIDRTTLFRGVAMAAAGTLLLSTSIADAQLAPLASASAASAPAAPAPDTASIWTLQDENASISTAKLTDRYYTNGLRLGWTSGTDSVPDFLARASQMLWGPGQTRIAFDLSQQIYTPFDTAATVPPPGDRPYAGVLMGNFSLINDKSDLRSFATVGLGILGPDSGGEALQNGFHDVIGQGHDNGWKYQLQDEPLLQVTTGGIFRLPVTQFSGLEVDALPEVTVAAGNLRVYAETGGVVRLGQGLQSDYGVARFEPGQSGLDAFKPVRPFDWYVFAGVDGRAVAHDVTLDGNDFRNSISVSKTPFVGEIEGGVAVMAFGARLTYTQVAQTAEFRHQKGGLHQFGSLALSVRF